MRRDAARRLARLHKAQAALARKAQADRVGHEAELGRVEADAGAIVRALNTNSPLHGLVVPTMAQALTRNAEHAAAVRANIASATRAAEEERVREEHLAERVAASRRAHARYVARREIEELATRAATQSAPTETAPTAGKLLPSQNT